MKRIVALIIGTFITVIGHAQLVFENFISDNVVDERAYDMIQTSDGGFFIGGTLNQEDFFAVKTDANGDTLWTGIYGGNDTDQLYDVVETTDGNYVLFGWTKSFGTGGIENYLVKLDKNNGDTIWTKYYELSGSHEGHGFDYTSDGGFIMTSASLSNGPDVNGFGMYVSRSNSFGDTLWTREIDGPNDESGSEIIQTADGNFVCAGRTDSYGNGGDDIYLVKFNDLGDTLWSATVGGPGDEDPEQLIELANGDLMVAGTTDSYGSGGDDYFIVKLSSVGDSLWSKTYGGPGGDKARDIKETSDGGFIITGQTVDFGATISGSRIIRTDSIGDTLWTYMYPGELISYGRNIIQTGVSEYTFSGTTWDFMNGDFHIYIAQIDTCTATFSSRNVSQCESYTSPSGNYNWTSSGIYNDTLTNNEGCDSVITINLTIVSPTASTITESVCSEYTVPSGDETYSTSGTYIDTIPNTQSCDSVITINLTIVSPTASTITESVCSEYTVPSGDETYSTSGTYLDTIPNTQSCDSVITINLTIVSPSASTITESVCSEYTVPSGDESYSTSGTYLDTIPNTQSCDSIITINLTIVSPTASTITKSVCSEYTVPSGDETYSVSGTYLDTIPNTQSCDSIITINLTIVSPTASTITESVCEEYTVPSGDETYSVSGTYFDTIPNAMGCDSILTLHVSITSIDTSLILTNNTLTATENDANYHWYNCNDSLLTNLADTNQSFTAGIYGSYAVEISKNGCVDSSSCHLVMVSSIEAHNFSSKVNYFPNPTSDFLFVDLGNTYEHINISTYTIQGKLVSSKTFFSQKQVKLTAPKAEGYYFIQISIDNAESLLLKFSKVN